MIKRFISDIVEEAAKAPTPVEKVQVLRQYDSPQLRGYLKMAMDKNLKWLIPEGKPPFDPCTELDVEFVLYNEYRRVPIFFGANPNLKPTKAEQLFITFLQSMNPKDAEFICNVVKDRKLPEGLNEDIIRAAFPGV